MLNFLYSDYLGVSPLLSEARLREYREWSLNGTTTQTYSFWINWAMPLDLSTVLSHLPMGCCISWHAGKRQLMKRLPVVGCDEVPIEASTWGTQGVTALD